VCYEYSRLRVGASSDGQARFARGGGCQAVTVQPGTVRALFSRRIPAGLQVLHWQDPESRCTTSNIEIVRSRVTPADCHGHCQWLLCTLPAVVTGAAPRAPGPMRP
jgi:hypothetical protein